jgi:hypothetical protein
MEAAIQAKRARRRRRRLTLNFITANSPALPNRNKVAFKIPANSMKIKAEPNSNRNTNTVLPFSLAGLQLRAKNHESQLALSAPRSVLRDTNHKSRYTEASICARPQSNSRTSRAIIQAPKGKVA